MPDQTQARSMIVYGYCSSTSGAFSGILLTEYGDYLGCTSSPTEAGLPTALRHHFLADFSGDHRLPLDSDFEYVPRPQVPTHAGLQRAIAAYMGQPVTPQMQSIDSAPKDGSPVWAEVCTLKENVFRTWIYWSSGAAKWAYASHPYDFPRDVHGWLPIAINQTMQFPPLTPESQSVLEVAGLDGLTGRRFCSAVIREAQRQACILLRNGDPAAAWLRLGAIADNLHSPLPPPPTREEMLKALQGLENWRQIEGEAIPAAGVAAGKRLEILRRGIAHYCHD